jgi:hypothetical protein
VIYEHRDPWWNDDVNRGKLLICPLELWQFYQQSHLRNGGGMGARNKNLALQSILFILAADFLHTIKSYMTWGLWLYFSKGRCVADFYRT